MSPNKNTTAKRKKHKVKKFFKKLGELIITLWKWLVVKAKKTGKATKVTAGFIITILIIMGSSFDCGYTKKRGFYCHTRWDAPNPDDVNKLIPKGESLNIQRRGN